MAKRRKRPSPVYAQACTLSRTFSTARRPTISRQQTRAIDYHANGASTACGFSCHRGLPVLRNRRARGGRGILSPKGGKGKKSRSPPPLPTRCRSIEFATLSTPFFLSTRALLVPCNCVEIVFRECVGRETRINTR